MDYDILNLGVACADKEGFEICYEAAREDFFESISGEDIITEKKTSVQKAPSKSKFKNILASLKKNKKKILFIIAGLTTLSLAIVALKKRSEAADDDNKRIVFLNHAEKEIDKLKTEAKDIEEKINKCEKNVEELESKSRSIRDAIFAHDTQEARRRVFISRKPEIDSIEKKIEAEEKTAEKWERKADRIDSKIFELETGYKMVKNKLDGWKMYV